VIGKSLNPRCFKNINKSALPVTYRANSKAWMRSDIFIEWLKYLDNYFRIKNKKILLLIDNAGSHLNQKRFEQNNDNEAIATDENSEEESVAESSRTAENRKKKIKKNLLIFLLLISNLCTFHQIRPPTYNQWMQA
jgi:hypothetical protein